jgi:HD-GYP domain-containing protein (c-di-GMP phosphodiesterase class II)
MHDNILVEARILGIADVVEAMASHRPYRPALGLPAALKEIVSHKGTLYDSQITDICIQIFNDKKFSFEP